MVVRDLNSMYNAVKRDEREVRLEDKGLEEFAILYAKDSNALKKLLKGGAGGAALGAGGIAAAIFTGGIFIPFALMGAGLFKLGKAITYDIVKGSKEDKELVNAKKQVMSKYSNINFEQFGKILQKYYKVTSEGNSYVTFTHK